MKVKVPNPQMVEWNVFNELRRDTHNWNNTVQGQFYKGIEFLQNAEVKLKEALKTSHHYWGHLTRLNGGNIGEAHVYDEKVFAKIDALVSALNAVRELAKDIDPQWTMTRTNYHFKNQQLKKEERV